ncbi:hypothetical protein [Streptomyces niveus]|uniref:hypothetical protein n=1 Tax=Streptomyces niveus TaxID=193462 RepID=UPI0036D412EC
MTDNPRWSKEVRWEIQRAMNAVVREAADVVTRRSSNGKWIAPGEIDELGDNPSLGMAGQIWVLDKLDAKIREAREVIERVQEECRTQSGIKRPTGESG